MTEESG